MTTRSITDRLGGLAFGGDYSPEQWDEPAWREDDELMRRARVNLATVGILSRALLEPEEGRYTSWEQVLPPRATQWHKNPARHWTSTASGPTRSSPPTAGSATRHIAGGGTLLVQYATGFVDDRLHTRLGGHPAEPLREALDIRVEEYRPLRQDGRITLSDGSHGTVWSESLRTEGAEALAACTHGMLTGSPALTRHRSGTGQGWYLSTRLDDADYAAPVGRLLKEADVEPDVPGLPAGVEAVTRHAPDGRHWQVLLNHNPEAAPLPDPAHDLLTDALAHELPPGGCAVLRGH